MFFRNNYPFIFIIQFFDFVSTFWNSKLNKTLFMSNWFREIEFQYLILQNWLKRYNHLGR